MEAQLNLLDIFRLIFKWRKTLAIISGVALLAAVIVALLMPNYYKSTAIFYAANPAMNDRQNLFREQAGNLPLEYFGSEKDVDRVLQICKSGNINGYVVNKYHLAAHYKIDSSTNFFNTKVAEEFKENSSMVRNELGAVEVTIFDTDPKIASAIANDIVATVDNINKSFFTTQNEKGIALMQKNRSEKQKELDKITDTLILLRHSNGSADLINTLDLQKKAAVKELTTLSKLYEQYTSAAGNDFTTLNVIEPAYPAEKKSKPIRWLIVVSTLLITFSVSVLVLLIRDKYLQVKPELV
jgi:uncharacterized protein involved in exopolysaccharide biosynthesis